MKLYFKDAQNNDAGGVQILFSSPQQYYLLFCRRWTDFPTTLPSATKKIWRITLDKSEGIRLKIHCNGVEVANVQLSDHMCTNEIYSSSWSHYWSKDVTQLSFNSYDTASDYYKPYYTGIIL